MLTSFFETPPHGAKRHPTYYLSNQTITAHVISYICFQNSKEGIEPFPVQNCVDETKLWHHEVTNFEVRLSMFVYVFRSYSSLAFCHNFKRFVSTLYNTYIF